MLLAASYGHLGRIEEARAAWTGLPEVNPDFSMVQREGVLPYKNASGFRRIESIYSKSIFQYYSKILKSG